MLEALSITFQKHNLLLLLVHSLGYGYSFCRSKKPTDQRLENDNEDEEAGKIAARWGINTGSGIIY